MQLATFRNRHRTVRLLAAMIAVTCALPAGVTVADQLNPYKVFTDSGPVSPQERERREQMRSDLYDRLSPAYRMTAPFVSEQSLMAIQQAIERYRSIVAAGGWPGVPEKVTLRRGDTSPEIVAIRRHLVIEGDLPAGDAESPTFDDAFLMGLSRFQIRNGLKVSGFVDQRTLRALNVPATERLQQLQTNLARLQQLMPIAKGARYVMVNVPSYTTQAVQNGTVALESNVVVGKPQRQTPRLSAKIVEVNFYPTWSVPDSVARKDLIPTIRKNPNYFYEQHFSVMPDWKAKPLNPAQVDWAAPEVVSYKFRQDPGPHNALGVVRINMPNKEAVYMHDTPLKQLFGQSVRAFSSGCVRVERVLDLVAWLLSDQKGWDAAKVEAAASSGESISVRLKKPVPVHFVYLSAFAQEDGVVQFRPDIYGRDATFGDVEEGADAVVAQQSRAITP